MPAFHSGLPPLLGMFQSSRERFMEMVAICSALSLLRATMPCLPFADDAVEAAPTPELRDEAPAVKTAIEEEPRIKEPSRHMQLKKEADFAMSRHRS